LEPSAIARGHARTPLRCGEQPYGVLVALLVGLCLPAMASAGTWDSTVTFTAGEIGTFSVEYADGSEHSGRKCFSCVLTTLRPTEVTP
jgi:hypothetical protein